MLRRGQRLEVVAERLNAVGEGVCRSGGSELRVFGLLPGEHARVSVDHVASGASVAFGSVLARGVTSAERRRAPCARAQDCSGCPLMVATPALQRALKTALVEEALGVAIDGYLDDTEGELGYRWSSKRVAAGQPGALVLGSYRRGTHHVASMSACLVDHPAIARAADRITAVANDLGVEPFDERSGRGDLRYVWLKVNQAGQVLVTLISGGPDSAASSIAAQLDDVAGVFWAVQPSAGNAIRGSDAVHLRGVGTIDVELAGETRGQGPLSFLQPNPAMAERCYAEMVRDLRGERALDLYSGAGITAALLRRSFREVQVVESFPEAAEALGVLPQTVVESLRLSKPAPPPDVVLANPPRAGLGAEVCARFLELGAARLHVMSCNPVSMARDLQALSARYRLESVRAYDTLPQTMHVELVVRLVLKR